MRVPKIVRMFGEDFDNLPEHAVDEDAQTVTVCKNITTETAHRLVNYSGKCAHIHGHSWQWEVCIEVTRLQNNGIAVDFGELKRFLNDHIHELFDHSLVLCESDRLVRLCKAEGLSLEHFLSVDEHVPARVVVMDCNPTSENLALYAKRTLQNGLLRDLDLADYVKSVRVRVNETCTSAAEV